MGIALRFAVRHGTNFFQRYNFLNKYLKNLAY